MSRRHYDKLIRDRIPQIIRDRGKTCGVVIMTEDEYRLALAQKLVEEAQEAAEAAAQSPGSLTTEIADIFEIIDTLIAIHDLDKNHILQYQANRREERGAFNHRLKLLWVEEPNS